MSVHRIYTMNFAKIYDCYIQKAEKKNRTNEEVDIIICRLTGYTNKTLYSQIYSAVTCEEFFTHAPQLHPNRKYISWTVCWVKIDDISEPLMKEIRYLDKLIDELAKGKPLEKILRV